jgi:flagellar biosynthesis protein FlhF
MKIKKYVSSDMRQAMRAIREEQGPDAVILSNRTLPNGVEITVAIDYEADAWASSPERSASGGGTAAALHASRSDGVQGFRELLAQREAAPAAASPAADTAVNAELRTLRRMLETQLAALAWNDLTRRSPLATELLRELTEIGFARDVAARVADALPTGIDFMSARRLAIARLADELTTTGDRWLDYGGTVAFVGPTGAGKSTAIAKLAARWVMRHGPKDLALIGADSVRVGAADEMAHLGRLLGVATYTVDHLDELPALLERVSRQRLVLIDTVGLSARDERTAVGAASVACREPTDGNRHHARRQHADGRGRGMPRALSGRWRGQLRHHEAR